MVDVNGPRIQGGKRFLIL